MKKKLTEVKCAFGCSQVKALMVALLSTFILQAYEMLQGLYTWNAHLSTGNLNKLIG